MAPECRTRTKRNAAHGSPSSVEPAPRRPSPTKWNVPAPETEGPQLIERQQPSLLLNKSVPITAEIDQLKRLAEGLGFRWSR